MMSKSFKPPLTEMATFETTASWLSVLSSMLMILMPRRFSTALLRSNTASLTGSPVSASTAISPEVQPSL